MLQGWLGEPDAAPLIMVQPCCSFEDTNTDSPAPVSYCWWFGNRTAEPCGCLYESTADHRSRKVYFYPAGEIQSFLASIVQLLQSFEAFNLYCNKPVFSLALGSAGSIYGLTSPPNRQVHTCAVKHTKRTPLAQHM